MGEIGICGDHCNCCPRFIATINSEPSELKKVTELWTQVGWREVGTPIEELMCYGCSSVKWCRYDTIRSCAQARGISNCGECDDYPCPEILDVLKRTEVFAEQCKKICSETDYRNLEKAFFLKRKKLDEINAERLEFSGKGICI